MTRPGVPAIDRVLDKCVETDSGCWEFTGARNNGYGVVNVDGKTTSAHRLVYEFFIGEIPDGLVTDHLVCENPPCCNPWHLDPVTRKVNTQRAHARTHCSRGHELTPENLYHPPSGVGMGICRKCIRIRSRRGYEHVIGWLETFDDPFKILDNIRAYLENPPAKRLWGDDVPRQPPEG